MSDKQIATDGGSYVQRDASTGGGAFTGRDYQKFEGGVILNFDDPKEPHAVITEQTLQRLVEKVNRLIILIDGVDPGDALKGDDVNARVSAIASIPEVRDLLVEKQREYLKLGSLVMEGRDIGSVVFPDTPYKLYIDASEEVRLARRSAEGSVEELAKRDKDDSNRKVSPLVIAEGATVIDSSEMTIEEVVEKAVELLREKGLEV